MIEKIKKLNSTEKGPTIIRFSLYMLFFLFVIILSIVANSTATPKNTAKNSQKESVIEKEKPVNLSFYEKQERLYKDDYEFSYKIIDNETEILYDGYFKDEITEGIKETDDEIVRYTIIEEKVYKIKFDSKEEYVDLYDGLENTFFDFESLFSKLNSSNTTIEKTDTGKKYNYKEIEGYNFEIMTDDNSIVCIKITKENVEYLLKFKF